MNCTACGTLHEHHHEHDTGRSDLTRVLIGAVGLGIAFFLPDGAVKIAVCAAAYAVAGYETAKNAFGSLAHGKVFDENLLMVIATVGAMALGDWTEAVAVMVFFGLGEWVQALAEARSRRSISALLALRPDSARVLREGTPVEVAPETVEVGETMLLRPGDRVPLDGVILEGSSSIDTAALTGESLPRDVGVGDTILGGSVCATGALTVRVTKPFGASAASRILELVENATERKAKTERFITRFARVYTPSVVGAAALIAILPPLLGNGAPMWGVWIHRALMLLVVSCPCALVLSVPLTYFAGIGGASKRGILVKGAQYLDTLARVEVVAFDKTGTLTTGVLTLAETRPHGCAAAELLEAAALAESVSDHPLALAVLRAHGTAIDPARVTDAKAFPGLGVSCVADGVPIRAGNRRFIPQAEEAEGTVIHVERGGEYIGCLTFSDSAKPETRDAIRELKGLGVKKVVLLTGDMGAYALCGAPIDEVRARLLPEDKVSAVEALGAEGVTAYVGDGINDAPVLARADVGIAMGALGTDAAIEAADVVLMRDNPRSVAEAIRIGRRTKRLATQNIAFALIVKFTVMALAVIGLATMWAAVFADAGVAVLCVLNATRAAYSSKKA